MSSRSEDLWDVTVVGLKDGKEHIKKDVWNELQIRKALEIMVEKETIKELEARKKN